MPVETCAICDKGRDPLEVPDVACGHAYTNRRTVVVEVVPAATAERLAEALKDIRLSTSDPASIRLADAALAEFEALAPDASKEEDR